MLLGIDVTSPPSRVPLRSFLLLASLRPRVPEIHHLGICPSSAYPDPLCLCRLEPDFTYPPRLHGDLWLPDLSLSLCYHCHVYHSTASNGRSTHACADPPIRYTGPAFFCGEFTLLLDLLILKSYVHGRTVSDIWASREGICVGHFVCLHLLG